MCGMVVCMSSCSLCICLYSSFYLIQILLFSLFPSFILSFSSDKAPIQSNKYPTRVFTHAGIRTIHGSSLIRDSHTPECSAEPSSSRVPLVLFFSSWRKTQQSHTHGNTVLPLSACASVVCIFSLCTLSTHASSLLSSFFSAAVPL